MKKYVFALVFVSFTTIVMSQDIKYGVRGALNVSNLDFDPDANFENKHRNGFAFGGFVDFNVTDNLSLLTELQWSAEGGKDPEIRADYIKLPILLRFSLCDDLMLGVGPQIALKTWQDTDGFSTFAFSGVAGAEYMITDELFLDARYYYGITNILDEDLTDLEAKNHVIQFGFGIKI
ncbi:porin family protein [Winogradskyella thalassocola]|uniref:Outer membrane protein beta-barrel domain-containing protein n=1 Tax=Winogradskyella thalassocola TaxID=262004 RepID=A0A1G8CNT7_9FLAO|nr:porin family protein [Winogradskyella thalassocola]SDH47002.1 Outer membrane protein beta-barrel domain-containing protein [Winogradskyella thalassocola]